MDDNAALFETWGIVREEFLVLLEAEGFSMRELTTVMEMRYEALQKRSTMRGQGQQQTTDF
jgi:hypothetical protein